MASDLRRLTDEEQLRHDVITTVVPLRFRRDRRGRRWARQLVARRGWRS